MLSEHAIIRRYGVGRASVRVALQELQRRLLVRRVRGAGTFVNRRIDYVISQRRRPSWHGTVTAAGARPRSVVRDIENLPLPADVATLLDRPAGSRAFRLVRQSYIDDLLASWSHEWVPVELVADLQLAMHAVESLDEVLHQVGRCPRCGPGAGSAWTCRRPSCSNACKWTSASRSGWSRASAGTPRPAIR